MIPLVNRENANVVEYTSVKELSRSLLDQDILKSKKCKLLNSMSYVIFFFLKQLLFLSFMHLYP